MRLLIDEGFNNVILDGLREQKSDLDAVRVQDVAGLGVGANDLIVLEWAAQNGCIVVTHDKNTMINHAIERVNTGKAMPGLFAVRQTMSIGQAIEELLILIEASLEGEWNGQVRFVPLR